jgi:hypothetical protein
LNYLKSVPWTLSIIASTPEVLRGNFRLTRANLKKAKRLEENPAIVVAVQQPEVSAGELVDF